MRPLSDCSACRTAVSLGPFCGNCGADQRVESTEGSRLLRAKVFVAAHRQPIYLPLITSTLCPHLANPDRTPFRHGLFLAAAALVGVSALKQLPILVVMTALGIPLLFVLYLWRSEVFRDVPARAMAVAAVTGVVLSVAWSLWTGALVANAYGIPLYAGFQMKDVLSLGLAASAGDTLLMLVPVVAVRLLRPPISGSLYGFVIGAFGALAYTSASTVTWLAPQFVSGLLENYDSGRLLSRAVLYGVFDPLTAAAAGGTIGMLLWFRPAARPCQPGHVRRMLALCAGVTACCYLGLYAVDAANHSRLAETAINLAITILALQTLRFAMQIAVLHEAPDDSSDDRVLCIHCEDTATDSPFCPRCGVARRASSRSARRRF